MKMSGTSVSPRCCRPCRRSNSADRANKVTPVDQESRSALAKGLILVGVATLVGNGAAFLLSMVAARVLGPADFGAFGALIGILLILATIGISTQALAARRVATGSSDQADVEGQLIRLATVVGAGIVVLGVVMAWPLGQVFSIPWLAVATGIASLGFVIFGSAAMGIAQGREEHVRFSVSFIALNGSRALGGIIGVIALSSVVGAGIGVLVGCIIGALIAYRRVCPGAWAPAIRDGMAAELGHIVHALMVLFTLTNIDVLLARLFLSETGSSEYSVGVLLAKIAFFLPNAVVIVLFPKMSGQQSRRPVLVATGLTAVVGLIITLFAFFFGPLVVRILGGVQYESMADNMWLFALEGSAFALVQVLLYSRLAAQDRKAVIAVWVALASLVAIVAIWRNGSLVEIVTTVVGVSLVLAVVGLFLDNRGSSKYEIPIESAE
ncbi:MAG: oligosaccharide flippase family protein [Candidatus Nanopelagicales bacterium]|nr:oligosaccharide flippase family protein [Candidatus Nanopelagicales bacterium]